MISRILIFGLGFAFGVTTHNAGVLHAVADVVVLALVVWLARRTWRFAGKVLGE